MVSSEDTMQELLQCAKFELDKIPMPRASLIFEGKILMGSFTTTVAQCGLCDGGVIQVVSQREEPQAERDTHGGHVRQPRVGFLDVRKDLLKAALSYERPGFRHVQTAYTSREAYYETMQANVKAEFLEAFDQSHAGVAVLIDGSGHNSYCGVPYHHCTHRFVARVVRPSSAHPSTEAERRVDTEEDRATLESLKDNIVSVTDDENTLFWITSVEVKEPSSRTARLCAEICGLRAEGNSLEHSGALTLKVRIFAGDFASRYRACTSLLSGQEASCVPLERALLNPRSREPGTYMCRRTLESLESSLRSNKLPINEGQLSAVHNLQYRVEVIHGPPGTGKSTTICHALSAHLPRGAAAIVTCVCNQAIDAIAEKLARNQDPTMHGHPMLVLGNAKRVGSTARQYTLDEQAKREELVVFMEKIVGILDKRVQAARLLQKAREEQFLDHGAEITRSRLTLRDLAKIRGLRLRALKALLREYDEEYAVSLRTEPSERELEQRWIRVSGRKCVTHLTVEAKMQEVHLKVVNKCRKALAKVAARVLLIDGAGRSQDPRFRTARTIDIGGYLQYETERLVQAHRWLSFAHERAPYRVVRRTHVFLCTIPSSYRVEGLREEYEEDFPTTLSFAICDEAAATAETYVPQMMSLSVENLLLLGDHKQLPPLVLARDHKDVANKRVARSLMERMIDGGYPCHQLRTQYRMPEVLCNLVSKLNYDGEVTTAQQKLDVDRHAAPMSRLRWFDGESYNAGETHIGTSFVNVAEVSMVLHLLQHDPVLSRTSEVVRVITFYKPQLTLFQTVFRELKITTSMPNVELATVDACQGTEAPHIILSTVRSERGRIGFAGDPRRINVAISRAQLSLTIVGCGGALSGDSSWNVVYDWFRTHGAVARLRDSVSTDNCTARNEANRMEQHAAARASFIQQKGLKATKGGKGLGKTCGKDKGTGKSNIFKGGKDCYGRGGKGKGKSHKGFYSKGLDIDSRLDSALMILNRINPRF